MERLAKKMGVWVLVLSAFPTALIANIILRYLEADLFVKMIVEIPLLLTQTIGLIMLIKYSKHVY